MAKEKDIIDADFEIIEEDDPEDNYDPFGLPKPKNWYQRLERRAYDNEHPKLTHFLNRFAWWGWRRWQWGYKNLIWNAKCPVCKKRMEVWLDGDLFMCKKCREMYYLKGSRADLSIPNLKLDAPTKYG